MELHSGTSGGGLFPRRLPTQYSRARSLTKALVIAAAITAVVLQILLCGTGGGPDPSPDEMSQEQQYPGGYCLPWLLLGLPTVIIGALALRGASFFDRSAWFIAVWLVFLVTPLAVAVLFGEVFPVMIVLWVIGFLGLAASVVAAVTVKRGTRARRT